MMGRGFGLLLALVAMLPLGCGRSQTPPAPPAGPEARIAVLSPALAAILCDLGLRERIVGRHAYDLVLDPDVPVCGEQRGINYETLLRVEPTHVLTEWGDRELPRRLRELAVDEGWQLRDLRVLTLQDVAAAAAEFVKLFPDARPVPRVGRLAGLAGDRPAVPRWEGRVLLLMSVSPIAALGPGSAHHELLVAVGGVPAISEGSPHMQLHAEDVLRLAPEAIVLIQPGGGGVDREARGVEERLGVIASLDIPALREGRLALIDHPLALLPSTALADVADEMAALLDGWAR